MLPVSFNRLRPGRARQQGVVLIVVLWVVALLMVLLAAFTAMVKVDRLVTGNVEQEVRGRLATEAVLHYLSALQAVAVDEWQQMPGETYKLTLNEQLVRFRIIPEAAFIPFNTLDVLALEQVLAGMGLDNAAELAQRVLDLREGRAETEEGELLEPVRVGSMMHLAALLDLDLDVLQGFEPLFSFAGEHVGVNIDFASDGVKTLLGIEAAPGESTAGDWVMSELYRVQVEVAGSVKPRQLEAVVVFSPGMAGYRLVRWNEYNVDFFLGE